MVNKTILLKRWVIKPMKSKYRKSLLRCFKSSSPAYIFEGCDARTAEQSEKIKGTCRLRMIWVVNRQSYRWISNG